MAALDATTCGAFGCRWRPRGEIPGKDRCLEWGTVRLGLRFLTIRPIPGGDVDSREDDDGTTKRK